jgi:hypothetical protein
MINPISAAVIRPIKAVSNHHRGPTYGTTGAPVRIGVGQAAVVRATLVSGALNMTVAPHPDHSNP